MPRALSLIAAFGLAVSHAAATWSIILIDTRTGEIAVGSATCLTGFDLRANTPVLLVGVGAATAQSFVDDTGQNRAFIRDQFLLGTSPKDMLDLLAVFDNRHQTRQYGLADTKGIAATFSGSGAGEWKGGRTGEFGSIIYAIQGNVLTGAPVVDEAVAAAIGTPGDLAEKMMAAMEAAREMGGDGRCSCSEQLPTSCGSPPEDFEKSAHIAYMLIARAGDRNGCNGVYRVGNSPAGLAAADFDGDGLVDLVASNTGGTSVAVLRNLTPPGAELAMFGPATNLLAGNSPRDLDARNILGGPGPDIAAPSFTTDSVYVLANLGGGSFGEPIVVPVGDGPVAARAADMNGDGSVDLVAANSNSGNVSVVLSNGAGGFLPAVHFPAGDKPAAIAIGDLGGGAAPDVAVTLEDEDHIAVLINDGSGGLAAPLLVSVGDTPLGISAADLDGDGDTDLACVSRFSNIVSVLRRDGGTFERTDYPVSLEPRSVSVGDLDGDDLDDLLVHSRNLRTLTFLKGDGIGGFAAAGEFVTDANNGFQALADFNGDGDLDVALTAGLRSSIITVDNVGLPFNSGSGCATGDYFMNFNVAFAGFDDPDPVFTLRAMFDEWRHDLVGHPDAVQSEAFVSPDILPGDGVSQSVLTVRPRDWQGVALSADLGVAVEHEAGSAGLAGIGPPTLQGDGSYTVALTAGVERGIDRLRITLDDGVRPVVLMPGPTLTHSIDPDVTGDGRVDVFDFLGFQAMFGNEDPLADVNLDGSLDVRDFLSYLTLAGGA